MSSGQWSRLLVPFDLLLQALLQPCQAFGGALYARTCRLLQACQQSVVE